MMKKLSLRKCDGLPLTLICSLEKYKTGAMKRYFDQDALLYPVETISAHVNARDYDFFLENNHFLKVVDTLQKYEQSVVDLDSQEGRDFIVFKRQLFQMYEVRNRSLQEHEAFSFEIERDNLKFLSEASLSYQKEMAAINDLEDRKAHAALKGGVFQRKTMTPDRLTGLGCFGVAAGAWAYFPYLAQYVGYNATLLGISASAIAGMIYS